MSAVTAMMKQVQQRAGQQQQERQNAKQMGTVLSNEEEGCDQGEGDEDPFPAPAARIDLGVTLMTMSPVLFVLYW